MNERLERVQIGKNGRKSYYYRCKYNHLVQSFRELNREQVDAKCRRCSLEDLSTWRDVVG